MKINLQNYEQYFIDYLDGNLNPAEEAELRNFVHLHPHLQAEFDDLENFVLIPEKIEYQNKHLLKEDEQKALEGISKAERLSIAFLENYIEKSELEELNQLKSNTRNKKTFEFIQKTKLKPEVFIYQNKSALKKKAPVFFLKNKTLYKIAATVLLLISFTFYFKRKNNNTYSDIALIPLKEIPLRKAKTTVQTKPQKKKMKQVKKETVLWAAFAPEPPKESQKNNDTEEELQQTHLLKAKKLVVETENNVNIIIAQNKAQHREIKEETVTEAEISEEIKIPLKKKMLFALKKTGKTIWYKATYSLRKNIKYKKEYLDDNKVLIAFKAGNYEFKKIKNVKKP